MWVSLSAWLAAALAETVLDWALGMRGAVVSLEAQA
jgi:hypothetical protein